jgi:hypothetical protein
MNMLQAQVSAVIRLHQHRAMATAEERELSATARQVFDDFSWTGDDAQNLRKLLTLLPVGIPIVDSGDPESTPGLIPELTSLPMPIVDSGQPIVTTAPYFEIRYGDFMNDEELVPVARLAFGNKVYGLEWLNGPQLTSDVRKEVFPEIYYYLFHKPLEGRVAADISEESWSYLKYHATTTSANLYGNIHWVYIDPNAAPRPAEPVVEE